MELGYHGPVFMDSDIYKTLEAIGWELESAQIQAQIQAQTRPRSRPPSKPSSRAQHAQAFADFAATAVGLLARVQRPDGYLNSYIQASGEPRYRTLASSHEMYCAGHLIQAAIALARGAGDPRAMDIATRLADHLVKEFAGQRNGLDGHPIIETALVELYRETGPPPTATWRSSSSTSAVTAWRAIPATAAATCRTISRSGSGPPRSATPSARSTSRRA